MFPFHMCRRNLSFLGIVSVLSFVTACILINYITSDFPKSTEMLRGAATVVQLSEEAQTNSSKGLGIFNGAFLSGKLYTYRVRDTFAGSEGSINQGVYHVEVQPLTNHPSSQLPLYEVILKVASPKNTRDGEREAAIGEILRNHAFASDHVTRFVEGFKLADGRAVSVWEFGGKMDARRFIMREARRLLNDSRQIPRKLGVRCLFYQVLRALDYLATRVPTGPVVHGDIHFGNVFIKESTYEPPRALLGDWHMSHNLTVSEAEDAPWGPDIYWFGVRFVPSILTCGRRLMYERIGTMSMLDQMAHPINDENFKLSDTERAELVKDLSFIDGDAGSVASAISKLTGIFERFSEYKYVGLNCPFYQEFKDEQGGDISLGMDLILRMINQDNLAGRVSPKQAIQHPYFDQLDPSCPDAGIRQ